MKIDEKLKENIALSSMTTLRIGGPAKYFVGVKTKEELTASIKWAEEKDIKYYILGGGSNILVSDRGFNGLIIKLENDGIVVRSERIECGAGVNLMKAARMSANNHLSGLEWGISIPGTIGGAIKGNAGAFGGYMSDIVETVDVFNVIRKEFTTLSNKMCGFDYKYSIFNEKRHLLIWSTILKFNQGDGSEIDRTIQKYINYRDKSQPKLPSAGCVFKNFKLEEIEKANFKLVEYAREQGVVRNGKISAGWLIDELGLTGKIIGGAKISLEHANFIVNTGKAKAEHIVMLISFIKQQVRDRFKVQLKEEIQYVGFE